MYIPAERGPSLRSGRTLLRPKDNPLDGEPSAPRVTDRLKARRSDTTGKNPVLLLATRGRRYNNYTYYVGEGIPERQERKTSKKTTDRDTREKGN